MSLIECTLGAATLSVNDSTYDFARDAHGRYVARVLPLLDRSLFLSVSHYREVPEHPEPAKPKRTRAATSDRQPAGDDQATDAGEGDGDAEGDDSTQGDASTGDGQPAGDGAQQDGATPPTATEKPKRTRKPKAEG